MKLLELPGGDFEGASLLGLHGDLYAARAAFNVDVSDWFGLLLMKNGFLQTNGPLWSLYIEWRIYLAAACLAMAVSCTGLIYRVLWIIGFFYALVQLRGIDSNAVFYASTWILGGSIAFLHTRVPAFLSLSRTSLLVIPLALLAVHIYFDPSLIVESRKLSTTAERSFQFLFGVFWAGLLFPRIPIADTAVRRVFMRLGDFSYTLYVLHLPLMLFVLSLSLNTVGNSMTGSLIVALGSVALVVLTSSFAGRLLEQKSRFMPILYSAILPLQIALRAQKSVSRKSPSA